MRTASVVAIQTAISISISMSIASASVARAQTMRRPVACSGCIANWYYFDETPGAGQSDWSCASSTYDGHRGSDFSLAGGNGAIATGYDIVAAADGTVVSTADGFYDHCTTCDASVDSRCGSGFGSGYGNHVVINHGAYRVIYGHMRQGSVRVAPDQTVHCGDVIGQIGSSGCTTGAHVHFETRPLGASSSSAFDPFQGACSPTSPSLWVSQGAHRSMPSDMCEVTSSCTPGLGAAWTCTADRMGRARCMDGADQMEPCPFGCADGGGGDATCTPAPDADGDGRSADIDCDDMDATRYPGAEEICGDGVDQDCDGEDLGCVGVDAGVRRDGGSLPPGTDAGVSEDAARGYRDGGARGAVEGCGCRVGAPPQTTPGGLVMLVGLALLVRRRSR